MGFLGFWWDFSVCHLWSSLIGIFQDSLGFWKDSGGILWDFSGFLGFWWDSSGS